jgi:hypothetical protein
MSRPQDASGVTDAAVAAESERRAAAVWPARE